MRVVGGEDKTVRPARLHGLAGGPLLALDGHEALTVEVLARPERQPGILVLAGILPVLVEAPQPEGQPGTVPLQERNLSRGKRASTPPRVIASTASICSMLWEQAC